VAASRKSKKFWIWFTVIVVVVLAAAGAGVELLVKGSSIDPNRIAKVTRGDVARSVVATGKIQPITKVEVKSKASGIVEKLYVDINNKVTKGQQLRSSINRRSWPRWTRSEPSLPPPKRM